MPLDTTPQQADIELGRVYRRAEFADRPPVWSSPLPSLEIRGEGKILIYGSNLPRQEGPEKYLPPIGDTKAEIEANMTLISTIDGGCAANNFNKFHDACMCSVWIAFCWDESSSDSAPVLRDACLIDYEFDARRRGLC